MKPINFYPIDEFDVDKKYISLASKVVGLFESDIGKGLPHLLLICATTQVCENMLFDEAYNKFYSKYSSILIVSGISPAKNKVVLQRVKDGCSKIIVCVDMFSEGIDIPQLKICAIHDKYKSLPIRLQLIFFARAQATLGEASVIANIVDDNIKKSLEELYSQDADWNTMLKDTSDVKIGREVELHKLACGFTETEVISLNQIRPNVSMFIYTTKDIFAKFELFHIKIDRRILYEDIAVLNEFGCEIICNCGRANFYYVVDRRLEDHEVRTLMDAVQSVSFITEKKDG